MWQEKVKKWFLHMNKKELLENLRISRQLNNTGETSIWKKAFDLYRKETGVNLSMKCNKCFQKVREWLEA